MRSVFKLLALMLGLNALACAALITGEDKAVSESTYDAALATELGADDYGMRSYVLAILKTGPNDASITDEAKRKELFAGHFANMGVMAEAEQLVLAGPLDGKMQRRGIYVFNVKSIEAAQELIKADPAIAAGIFEVELHQYYGSAALMAIQKTHTKIQKKKIG